MVVASERTTELAGATWCGHGLDPAGLDSGRTIQLHATSDRASHFVPVPSLSGNNGRVDITAVDRQAGITEVRLVTSPTTSGVDMQAGTTRSRAAGGSLLGGLVRAMRPRQWPKNLLVLAAPLAAGSLQTEVWRSAVVATLAFVAASAAVYLGNDTVDREADRGNPRTADRPIASGLVSPAVALSTATVLAGVGLVAMATTTWQATIVLVLYVGLNVGYNLGLKQVPVVELMIVASGYVLRAAVGGLATGVALSAWFLSVASFAALFIVTVKRLSERTATGHRAVMDAYPDGMLMQVRSMALTATTLTYVLWAFETGIGTDGGWYELSVVPFLLGVLRYTLVTWDGAGASPEEVILGDRALQATGIVWLGMLAVAVHG